MRVVRGGRLGGSSGVGGSVIRAGRLEGSLGVRGTEGYTVWEAQRASIELSRSDFVNWLYGVVRYWPGAQRA